MGRLGQLRCNSKKEGENESNPKTILNRILKTLQAQMTVYPKRVKSSKRRLKFSAEVIERDNRQVDIVEINFKDATAQVVQDSDAPKLTKKVLKEKGAPIQDRQDNV